MRNKSLLFLAFIFFTCLTSCMKRHANFSGELAVLEADINPALATQISKNVEILPGQSLCSLPIPKIVYSDQSVSMFETIPHHPSLQSRTNPAIVIKTRSIINSPKKTNEIIPEKKVNFFTLFLLAAFFPPLAVGIKKSFRSWHFYLTLGLTLSFFFPGMVYAFILMIREKNKE